MNKKISFILVITTTLAIMLGCSYRLDKKEETLDTNEDNPKQNIAVVDLKTILNEIPKSLPEGLTVYSDARQIYSDSKINSGKNFFFGTDDDIQKVYDFYKTNLTQAGWTTLKTTEPGGKMAILEFTRDDSRLGVYIMNKVPAAYPAELDLQGTFVNVLYDYPVPANP